MSFRPRLHFLGSAEASIPGRLVPGCEWGVGGAWSGTGPSKPPFILQPFIPLSGALLFFSALAWHEAESSIDSAAVGRSSSSQAAARGLAAVGKGNKWQGLQGRNHRATRRTSPFPVWLQPAGLVLGAAQAGGGTWDGLSCKQLCWAARGCLARLAACRDVKGGLEAPNSAGNGAGGSVLHVSQPRSKSVKR